jgi:hypothetical protein
MCAMSKVVAKATFHNAIREPFNWLNIIAPAAIAVMGAYFLNGGLSIQSPVRSVVGATMLVAGVVAAMLYIRTMHEVVFELDDDGIRYQAGRRVLTFAWKQVESFKLDLPQKQMTFWVGGKPHRLHHYGITQDEFAEVALFLQAKLREFQIPQHAG